MAVRERKIYLADINNIYLGEILGDVHFAFYQGRFRSTRNDLGGARCDVGGVGRAAPQRKDHQRLAAADLTASTVANCCARSVSPVPNCRLSTTLSTSPFDG